MTCTMPQLRGLLETEGLHYYIIPDQDGVMLPMKGSEGTFQFRILLELDGEFMQIRSSDYLYCPKGHPHLDATFQTLGEANYRLRLVKFGWDPRDGEIAVYADLWMKDAEVTQEQFSTMVNVYMSVLDEEYPKLKAAMETGVGPGEEAAGTDSQETIDSL